jgi:branched-chain amino acid transport system ATP-binding protein
LSLCSAATVPGKSTTLKTLMGIVRPRSGRIVLDGTPTQELHRNAIAALGMQLVPEERVRSA